MKIIVTHMSPDLDAIGSVWVVKRFLPGWSEADVEFVPAGLRSERVKNNPEFESTAIINYAGNEIMHVDTGLGPLDHHQTADMDTSGAMRSWEFVRETLNGLGQQLTEQTQDAITRIMKVIVQYDHFQEVYRPEAADDYQEFSIFGINEGLQYLKPGEDDYYVEFGRRCLDYLLSYFENKVWAEKEMAKGIIFATKFGKALGIESMNESVVKLAQKLGYILVVRKDTRRGFVSIKTLPKDKKHSKSQGMDLTLAYEQLSKMDPEATWFLHVGKKMLLNGSVKNPNMKPTKLSLEVIIKVLKNIYS